MLHIRQFSTSRLNVQLQECSIGAAMECALMPETAIHASDSAFLRACIKDGGDVPDPAKWTIQERALAIGHYLIELHQKDFKVGADGVFSDYVDTSTDIPKGSAENPLLLGELEGDIWHMQHLYGYMAESIERLQGLVPVPNGEIRLHWQFGCMAAQLFTEGNPAPDASNPGLYDDYLMGHMQTLLAMPTSAMAKIFSMYVEGCEKLHHFFEMRIGKDGINFAPKPREGEAEANLPPATFPSYSCINQFARDLAGK